MAPSLRPHVKLVCPVCGVTLPTYVQDLGSNSANWVLTPWSQNHLDKQHV